MIKRDTLNAEPKYCVDETVHYRDRQDRHQIGHVKRIEATWHGVVKPLVIYTLYHPSYRNNEFHTTDAQIDRSLSERELQGYRYE